MPSSQNSFFYVHTPKQAYGMYLSVQTITTKRFTGGCALAEYLGTYVLNECEGKKKTEVLYVTGYRFVLKLSYGSL